MTGSFQGVEAPGFLFVTSDCLNIYNKNAKVKGMSLLVIFAVLSFIDNHINKKK